MYIIKSLVACIIGLHLCQVYGEDIIMPVPEQWITIENGKMLINQSVHEKLKSIDMQCAVISIAGDARTGKCYLLNLLMDEDHGFSIGSTIRAETKRIWLWVRKHPYIENTALVLLDTEGLEHIDKGNVTQDIMIFALALLSTDFIYNIQGNLLLNDLYKLESVVKLVEFMSNKQDGDNKVTLEPHLSIVIRDFFLDIVDENDKNITAEQYLSQLLKHNRGHNARLNNIKKSIFDFFPTQSLHTMVKPVDDDNLLKKLDQVPKTEIKPDFLKQANLFKDTILNSSKVLKLNDAKIKLTGWAKMAEEFVKAINNQNLGNILHILKSVEDMINDDAIKASLSVCENFTIDRSADFTALMTLIRNNALEKFKAKYFGGSDALKAFEVELNKCIESIKLKWDGCNENHSFFEHINCKNVKRVILVFAKKLGWFGYLSALTLDSIC